MRRHVDQHPRAAPLEHVELLLALLPLRDLAALVQRRPARRDARVARQQRHLPVAHRERHLVPGAAVQVDRVRPRHDERAHLLERGQPVAQLRVRSGDRDDDRVAAERDERLRQVVVALEVLDAELADAVGRVDPLDLAVARQAAGAVREEGVAVRVRRRLADDAEQLAERRERLPRRERRLDPHLIRHRARA
jgi:hypothetical protein